MVRSSLPFSSPLMTTDLPMFTTSLAFWLFVVSGRTACAAAAGAAADASLVGTVGCAGCRTASSRFHILNLPDHFSGYDRRPRALQPRVVSGCGQYKCPYQDVSSPYFSVS